MAVDMDEATQARLIQQIGHKHPDAPAAVRRLYLHYRPRLLAFFRGRRLTIEECEDLLQEVFLKVSTRATQFAGISVSGWIYQIARHQMYDHLRPRSTSTDEPVQHISIDDDGDDDTRGHLVNASDWFNSALSGDPFSDPQQLASHAIDDCVSRQLQSFEKFHPDRAEVIRLTALEGWSMAQIAVYLQRQPGATREYLSQCRKKLKEFLQPCRHLLSQP